MKKGLEQTFEHLTINGEGTEVRIARTSGSEQTAARPGLEANRGSGGKSQRGAVGEVCGTARGLDVLNV
jgi:hypothetical protein